MTASEPDPHSARPVGAKVDARPAAIPGQVVLGGRFGRYRAIATGLNLSTALAQSRTSASRGSGRGRRRERCCAGIGNRPRWSTNSPATGRSSRSGYLGKKTWLFSAIGMAATASSVAPARAAGISRIGVHHDALGRQPYADMRRPVTAG
jgi:hypothetical protein